MKCDCSCMQIMQGEQGVVAHVKLPPHQELDQYDKLELDFTLGCPGRLILWCPESALSGLYHASESPLNPQITKVPLAADRELHRQEKFLACRADVVK